MPFTPFHIPPSATVAFLCKKRIDVPVFILACIAIDLEPYTIEFLKLDVPLHGVFHSLTMGTLVGLIWGACAYLLRNSITRLMNSLKLAYQPLFRRMMISAILGVWLNVLIDAFIYPEIRLLYPIVGNPLYGLIDVGTMIMICTVLLIPTVILYYRARKR